MKNNLKNKTLTAMFLAIGMVLPMFTGQIPQIGSMLLPMHLPVFLCALVCGRKYGLPMAFELAAYAFVAGFLYEKSRWQCLKALYRCLLAAMIAGRVVWGIAQVVLLGIGGNVFTFQAFIGGSLLNAVPGIHHRQHAADRDKFCFGFHIFKPDVIFLPRIVSTVRGDGYCLGIITD